MDMRRFFRQILRPTASSRRFVSGVCAALLLAILAFSSLFAVFEADHDCHGDNCRVCQEIHYCIGNFHLPGPMPGESGPSVRADAAVLETPPVRTIRPPATTLLTLDVKLDE